MKSAWIIGLWVATTATGFWWYDGRYRLPVERRPAERLSMGKSLAEPGAKVTLLAFYSPDCACSRFAVPHIKKLAEQYGSAGLKVLVVVEDGDDSPEGLTARKDKDKKIARAFGVPAAPGAVVLDADGKVVYSGGFNVARFCDDPQTAFAQQAIAATLSHQPVRHPKGEFYGCAMNAAP